MSRSFGQKSQSPRIKICGLSREEDIEIVNRVLPDYIGFVFAPSRRRVDTPTAAALKTKLDPRIKAVGVFVNENVETITEIYRKNIINMVQLHGDENDEYIDRLKHLCGCSIIKAIGVGDALPVLPSEPDYLLFDTLAKGRGGTGKNFDWSVLKNYHGQPYFLAGGLNSGNVSSAISSLSPFCIDVSSGVEIDGIKNEKKVDDFVRLVRGKMR